MGKTTLFLLPIGWSDLQTVALPAHARVKSVILMWASQVSRSSSLEATHLCRFSTPYSIELKMQQMAMAWEELDLRKPSIQPQKNSYTGLKVVTTATHGMFVRKASLKNPFATIILDGERQTNITTDTTSDKLYRPFYTYNSITL